MNAVSSSVALPEVSGTGKFPSRLHRMLESAEKNRLDHIASWLPCGRAFAIHDRKEFFKMVMPTYFPGMTSYESFRRQLGLYGIYQQRNKPPSSTRSRKKTQQDERQVLAGGKPLLEKSRGKKKMIPTSFKNDLQLNES
jgi:hypothetical protein